MKSFLIIGLGRFGRHMAMKLLDQKHEVLAIEFNEERAAEVSKHIPDVQIGDATSENYIRSLGVNNFDICVVAVADKFQSSLEITALLKENHANYIIARANSDVHRKFLKMAGADEIIYAEREMAEKLAVKYGDNRVYDYIKLSENYSIYEIELPKSWIGKSISNLEIRQKYNLNILAIKRDDNTLDSIPAASYVFKQNETIVVMGHNNDMQKFFKKNIK